MSADLIAVNFVYVCLTRCGLYLSKCIFGRWNIINTIKIWSFFANVIVIKLG